MNKYQCFTIIGLLCVVSSCSKIEVDEERINLVEEGQWSGVPELRLTGEVKYCFAESDGIDDCLFFDLPTEAISEGEYHFYIRFDKKKSPFKTEDQPTVRTLSRTPAEIVLIHEYHNYFDSLYIDVEKGIKKCNISYVRDGIISVSIEGKDKFFIQINSITEQWISGIIRCAWESR